MSHDPAAQDAGGTSTANASRKPSRNIVRGTARFFGPSVIIAVIAPFIFPGVRRAARPVAKGLIKGGLILGESVREAATIAREDVGDLFAEVKAEREVEAARESGVAAAPTKEPL